MIFEININWIDFMQILILKEKLSGCFDLLLFIFLQFFPVFFLCFPIFCLLQKYKRCKFNLFWLIHSFIEIDLLSILLTFYKVFIAHCDLL